MIQKRFEYTKKEWWEASYPVLRTYNKRIAHNVTKHTPEEALKQSNRSIVKFNIDLKKEACTRYPDLEVGDTVRVFKTKIQLDKKRIYRWSSKKCKAKGIKESMNQNFYDLERYDKPLMRSDLFLCD